MMIEDDAIERLLRADASSAIPDEGFAARVMAALPRPRGSRTMLQSVLVVGSALVGSVLAALLAPSGASPLQGFADLARLHALTPAAIGGLALCGALLVSAAVLAAETD